MSPCSRRTGNACWRATLRGPSSSGSWPRPGSKGCCPINISPWIGTLIEAWASLKSFKRKDTRGTPPDDPGNPTVNFHGERRSNETHASTTDPDARLFRKGNGQEAKLYYQGPVLMENRHGLAVAGCVTRASGRGERAAAVELIGALEPHGRVTLGADQADDQPD